MTVLIENICFSRDERILFQNICGKLNPGQWLEVSGANGSGKSTLLRILAGLIKPNSGSFALPAFHYIGHSAGIQPGLSVFEQIHWQCALMREKISAEDITKTINALGLRDMRNILTAQLSAGQQKRVGLALLFLIPRTLWILDEPYTALDKIAQHLLNIAIENHLKKGGVAIIATHQDMSIMLPPTDTIRLEQGLC